MLTRNALIKSLEKKDLPDIARIHRAAFPESVLTKLGAGAVQRYYAWQLEGPHESYFFGVYDAGKLVGFCCAGVFRGAVSGFLKKNWRYLACAALLKPWIFLTRERFQKYISGLKILRRSLFLKKARAPGKPIEKNFGILALAVHPDHRKRGLGKFMMDEAAKIAVAKGFQKLALTVNVQNIGAINFYLRLGWIKVVGTDNVWKGRMAKDLSTCY